MLAFATEEENKQAIQRLTALWALSESGLGGIMFALKIPFTGFFLGAFAVVMISLIAWISERNYRQIVQSTLLVIMVKAMVSPHSPPPAYIAVAFQGFAGALIFRVKYFKASCIFLGMLTMMESALQKLIVLTLIFGKDLWTGVYSFFADLKISLGLHALSFSWLLIGIYLLLYACWGACVGIWASRMPDAIHIYRHLIADQSPPAGHDIFSFPAKKKNRAKQWMVFTALLLFIVTVFIFNGGSNKLLRILLRSISAVLLLYFVLAPLLKYLVSKWVSAQTGRKKEAQELMLLMPQMRGYVSMAYALAKQRSSGFTRMKDFVVFLLCFALYGK